MVEEVLLDIARIGAKPPPGVAGEFRRSAISSTAHRKQDAVNPCIDRNGIESLVGKEQDAIRNLHAHSRKFHEGFAQHRRFLFGNRIQIQSAFGQNPRGFQQISGAVAQSAIPED